MLPPTESKSSGQLTLPDSPRVENVADLVHVEWGRRWAALDDCTQKWANDVSHCFNLTPSHTAAVFIFLTTQNTYKKEWEGGGKTQMTWSLVERKKSSPKHPPPFARHTQLYSQQEFCSNLFSLCVCRQEKLCFVSGLYFQLMKTDECIERVHLVHPRDRLNHPHHQASLFFSLDPTNTVICW